MVIVRVIVMMMVVGVVVAVIVISCGWSHAADCDCADNA
jgi:hypothetical protein